MSGNHASVWGLGQGATGNAVPGHAWSQGRGAAGNAAPAPAPAGRRSTSRWGPPQVPEVVRQDRARQRAMAQQPVPAFNPQVHQTPSQVPPPVISYKPQVNQAPPPVQPSMPGYQPQTNQARSQVPRRRCLFTTRRYHRCRQWPRHRHRPKTRRCYRGNPLCLFIIRRSHRCSHWPRHRSRSKPAGAAGQPPVFAYHPQVQVHQVSAPGYPQPPSADGAPLASNQPQAFGTNRVQAAPGVGPRPSVLSPYAPLYVPHSYTPSIQGPRENPPACVRRMRLFLFRGQGSNDAEQRAADTLRRSRVRNTDNDAPATVCRYASATDTIRFLHGRPSGICVGPQRSTDACHRSQIGITKKIAFSIAAGPCTSTTARGPQPYRDGRKIIQSLTQVHRCSHWTNFRDNRPTGPVQYL